MASITHTVTENYDALLGARRGEYNHIILIYYYLVTYCRAGSEKADCFNPKLILDQTIRAVKFELFSIYYWSNINVLVFIV